MHTNAELPNLTGLGKGLFFGVGQAPTPRGLGPSAPQCWGSLLFMRTPFGAELPIWRGNTSEGGRVSCGQPRLPPQESGVPTLPNFGVLPCLCLHPL